VVLVAAVLPVLASPVAGAAVARMACAIELSAGLTRNNYPLTLSASIGESPTPPPPSPHGVGESFSVSLENLLLYLSNGHL
jgi:hypothetical protein